jgi:hypothetical protein
VTIRVGVGVTRPYLDILRDNHLCKSKNEEELDILLSSVEGDDREVYALLTPGYCTTDE